MSPSDLVSSDIASSLKTIISSIKYNRMIVYRTKKKIPLDGIYVDYS